MSDVKKCHYHGDSTKNLGTKLLRVTCPKCDIHKIEYVCDQCAASIRTYEAPGSETLTVTCNYCSQPVRVVEHWKIIGAA